MNYLTKYGKGRKKFQEGGVAPAPAGGEMSGEDLIALAEATVAGDQAAAAQLGMLVAPMLLEQAGAAAGGGGGGGGAPMPQEAPAPTEGEPVFRKGGLFVRKA